MSTVELEKVGKLIDDAYRDIPCERCTAWGGEGGVGEIPVKWLAPGCTKDLRVFLFCETCATTQTAGHCVCCDILGHYEIVV